MPLSAKSDQFKFLDLNGGKFRLLKIIAAANICLPAKTANKRQATR
jgi:hypothetical protein